MAVKISKKKKSIMIKKQVWGLIYAILGLVSLLSIIGASGFVLEYFKSTLGAVLGFGVYVLPITFWYSAYILLRPLKLAVKLRMWTINLFPFLLSALIHIIFVSDKYNFIELINTGGNIKSGGIISGSLANLLALSVSKIGAIILLVLIVVFCVFTAFNISLRDIYELFFVSDEPDEKILKREQKAKEERIAKLKEMKRNQLLQKEEKRELRRQVQEVSREVKQEVRSKRVNIDIELDDDIKDGDIKRNTERAIQDSQATEYYVTEFNPKEFETDHTDKSISINDNSVHIDADDFNDGYVEFNESAYVDDRIIENNIAKNDNIEYYSDEIIQYNTECDIIMDEYPINDSSLESYIDNENINKDYIDDVAKDNINIDFVDVESLQNPHTTDTANIGDTDSPSVFNEDEYVNPVYQKPTYNYPPIHLLNEGKSVAGDVSVEMSESSERLIDTLKSFNIDANIINIIRGPSVTRFEIQVSRGVKFSKITSLSDDIALSLGASNVRIAPIPDKIAIGIEVPNKIVQTVYMREVIASKEFMESDSLVSFAVGKDITGKAIIGDIGKMPHMLIAGTTGSGKSVCINSLLVSLLFKATPDEVRLIMIDPKMIELGSYNGVPHLLIPVVTDPKKAAGALNWAVAEMMNRYKLFAEAGVRDLASYNKAMEHKIKQGELAQKLPQIVIVIDELADLMMVAAREVEEAICRIAQMARAAGMHLIIATQRPSADVITGIMKANIPSRIAFAVASQIESRIILDQTGADKLIGKGDMLYFPLGLSKPTRVQGCFLTSDEVNRVVEHVKAMGNPDYSQEVMNHIESVAKGEEKSSTNMSSSDEDDVCLNDAIEIALSGGQISTSLLQRKLKLGYARAARIIDLMEERGIIGEPQGSKPRQVLISREDFSEMSMRNME